MTPAQRSAPIRASSPSNAATGQNVVKKTVHRLAFLKLSEVGRILGFMCVGFVLNFFIGVLAYLILRAVTRMRHIDQATVAGYYGSDSAGTFVTCIGVLATAHIAYDAYMPVMLALMEIPGCLVALYLVIPLGASLAFGITNGSSIDFSALQRSFSNPDFGQTLLTSLELALATTIIMIVLVTPTTYWVQLRLPRARPLHR